MWSIEAKNDTDKPDKVQTLTAIWTEPTPNPKPDGYVATAPFRYSRRVEKDKADAKDFVQEARKALKAYQKSKEDPAQGDPLIAAILEQLNAKE